MKVYIGNRTIEDLSFKSLKDISILKIVADDSECTTLVLDGILKNYKISEIGDIINLAISKLRIGGELIITDIDFDIMIFTHKKIGNLMELNKMVESVDGFKSFLTYNMIIDSLKSNNRLKLNSIDINNLEFKLSYKREL